MTGRVVAVNVGHPREIEVGGRTFTTAIFKEPVEGPQPVRGVHVGADEQVNLEDHGGPDKAVYAYASEDTDWWAHELERDDLAPGQWGENLTLAGVDVSGALIGERWRVGTAVLRVTMPRVPCFKLAARMGDPRFAPRFGAAGRPGAYLAIEVEGAVAAGDEVEVLSRPDHATTVAAVADAWHGDGGPRRAMAMVAEATAT